jgi:hypothetical protein
MSRSGIVAFLAGVLFAVGLAVSGMTQPAKVIGFLDITGAWDPSLAFVMIGAIGVHFVARRLILRRSAPLGAPAFDEPKLKKIDAPLVVGAVIFGIGWGISGYCPGPAIVTLGTGSLASIVFFAAMAGGMWVHRFARPKVRSMVATGVSALQREPLHRAQPDG